MYFKMRLGTDDQDIAEWLDAQENKTQAVKDAIRAAMDSASSIPASGAVDLDLGAIRCVFEAVLDERLAGLSLATGRNEGGSGGEFQEDRELASKLDAMF